MNIVSCFFRDNNFLVPCFDRIFSSSDTKLENKITIFKILFYLSLPIIQAIY